MKAAKYYIAWFLTGGLVAASLFGIMFLTSFITAPDFIGKLSITLLEYEVLSHLLRWTIHFSNLPFPIAIVSIFSLYIGSLVAKGIDWKGQLTTLTAYGIGILTIAASAQTGTASGILYMFGLLPESGAGFVRVNQFIATILFPACVLAAPRFASRPQSYSSK